MNNLNILHKMIVIVAAGVVMSSAIAQQPVVPTGPFNAPLALTQNYDAIPQGLWFFNLLLGSAHIIQPNMVLAIQPGPGVPFSPPHYMYPRGNGH